MRRYAKALQIGIVLAMTTMVLTGCGRREQLDRGSETEVVVFQMDAQTQNPEMTPPQKESASKEEPNAATNSTTAPTAAPKNTEESASEKAASNFDIEQLMDDLENTLNELDAAIKATDQDTLTDATLAALGK